MLLMSRTTWPLLSARSPSPRPLPRTHLPYQSPLLSTVTEKHVAPVNRKGEPVPVPAPRGRINIPRGRNQ
jgi:hypothetical protein